MSPYNVLDNPVTRDLVEIELRCQPFTLPEDSQTIDQDTLIYRSGIDWDSNAVKRPSSQAIYLEGKATIPLKPRFSNLQWAYGVSFVYRGTNTIILAEYPLDQPKEIRQGEDFAEIGFSLWVNKSR